MHPLRLLVIYINGKATLRFNETNYIGQDGTLDHIASRYDYAEATITITGITESDEIITAEKSVDFENQQAIVKFSLQSGGSPVNAKYIIVNGIKITPAQATNEIYAAIPGAVVVHITAFDGTNYYNYSNSGANFENGNYYIVNVSNLKKRTTNVDLSDNEVLATLTTHRRDSNPRRQHRYRHSQQKSQNLHCPRCHRYAKRYNNRRRR